MRISVNIPDNVYESMIAGAIRRQGTIGLISPTEADFHPHRQRQGRNPDLKYMKLAHGRTSVTSDHVRLTLTIDRYETGIVPWASIDAEAALASEFVRDQMES